MKKIVLLLAAIPLLFASCNSGYSSNEELPKDTNPSVEFAEQPVLSQEELYSSIDGVRDNIEGTVWTYTEVGSRLWFKLVFRDGKVDYYCSFPAAGEWGESETSYYYTIEEHRYSDSGRKYISVDMRREPSDEHWCFQLIPSSGQSSMGFGNSFIMDPHDYVWD